MQFLRYRWSNSKLAKHWMSKTFCYATIQLIVLVYRLTTTYKTCLHQCTRLTSNARKVFLVQTQSKISQGYNLLVSEDRFALAPSSQS